MSSTWEPPVQITLRGASLANEELNFRQKVFFVNPRTSLYRYWETINIISVYLTCLVLPFQASFDSQNALLWVVAYIADVIFCTDIVLKFFVGFYSKGTLVTDRSLIRRRYLRSTLIPDVLAAIPLEIFASSLGPRYRWHQALAFLRLNRMIRVLRLLTFFGHRENKLGTHTSLVRAIKYVSVGTITIHVMACAWYALSCANSGALDQSCFTGSWAVELETGIEQNHIAKRYILSLYWATATATSTGYGDVHAVNMTEKWVSVLFMLTGIALFFGFILGGMASIMTNLDSSRSKYVHHLDVVKDHMTNMQISPDIRCRIMAYYEYLWTHHRGVSGEGMFNDLPLTFQAELSLSINEKVLERAPLFRGLDPGFKRMLSLVIRKVFYMPNQIITRKGDIGHHMCYIHRGRVDILCEDELNVLVTLKEGQLFGELGMVYNLQRAASVRASAPCVIFMLDRVDLKNIVRHYPEVADQLHATIDQRCNLDESQTSTAGPDTNIILNMENEQATKCLRQSVAGEDFDDLDINTRKRWMMKNKVIKAHSRFAVAWERLVFATLLIVCLLYTFIASFTISLHAIGYGESAGATALFAFTYLLDLVLVADFILRFNMATETKGELQEIRGSYKWSVLFWLDLLAILPIEIFAVCQPVFHQRWHTVAFLRLNRLLKAIRIPRFFANLENSLSFPIGKVRAAKFTIYIVLLTHFSACVWFFNACFGAECTPGSWAQHISRDSGKAGVKDYVASLYWAAATMSSTGYGDIHAFNTSSQLIAIIVMLIGLLLYGYCLSSIAATLTNSAAPKVQFFAKMTAVRKFMVENNLNPTLIEQTANHLSMLWRSHRGEVVPGEKRLMEDMPLTLQQDVTSEESKAVLQKVPIFMEIDDEFMKKLSQKTTSYLFAPGDYIVYAGDMGREMYSVRQGIVEVIGDDDVTVVSTLGPGAYFGEVGLLFGENRFVTVRAKTYCEMLMLTKPDFDKVLSKFPLVSRQIRKGELMGDLLAPVRKEAMETTKHAVRRLSLKCAQGRVSPDFSFKDPGLMSAITEETVEEDIKQPYQEQSIVLRMLSKALMRRAILPSSTFFKVWQGICLVVAAILPVSISLQAAFLHTDITLWTVNYFFDIICLVDMYIKFHLAFYNENKALVTHPLFTARNYLRTNFVLDLLASFPTDIIVLAVWPEDLGILRILALARLNRTLNLYKVNQFCQFMIESIGKYNNLIGQLKFGLYMAIFTHCICCGWFLLACRGLPNGLHHCAPDSWVEMKARGYGLAKTTLDFQYIYTLYWASSTSASVGYGDIHAYTGWEMAYALLCMISGIVFYGYIIASVAAGVANADAQRARYQERFSAIKRFLQGQDISGSLRDRIVSYYEYLWLRNKGVDASSLFEGLPPSLQTDITFNLYRDMIEKVPLFKGIGVGFLKMLSMHVKPVYFLAEEYLVRKGDIGHEMYFIHLGTVEVVTDDDEPIVMETLEEGSLFGEISVVFSYPRQASIRAKTNCDVFVLTKEGLDEVLLGYPKIQKTILQTATARQHMVGENEDNMKTNQEHMQEDKTESKYQVQDNEETADEPSEPATWRTRIAEQFVQFVILPDSKVAHIKFLNILLVVATTLTITYMAAYQDHPWYLISFNYVCEFSFYVEIYLNFHMAYINDIGAVICDGPKLMNHYLTGHFPLDIVASFPIDIFAMAAPADRQLFWLSYLRLLHLLRLIRFQQYFYEMSQRLDIDVSKVRVLKFFLQLVMVVHAFTCLWFFAACPFNQCSSKVHTNHNWVEHQGQLHRPPFSRYSTAAYWVVATMTSTGYGDIHADNTFELAVSSLVMIFGKLLFGFILGNIASTLANAEIRRVKYEEKMDAIKAQLVDQNIPGTLQDRVMNFYEFTWDSTRGIKHETLFFDMPLCLNAELHQAMVKEIMCRVPLFEKAEPPFIRLLCTKVKPGHFFANEYIVRKGDIGHEMFIIHTGLVEVVTDDDPPKVIQTLGKDSFFGEVCLVYASPQKESVRAVTDVVMHILSKDDVDSVFAHYEDVSQQAIEVANALYRQSKKSV